MKRWHDPITAHTVTLRVDRRLAVVAVLSAGLVAGCATFHAQPLHPTETAAAFEARRLTDPGLRAFLEHELGRPVDPWPPASWDLPLLTLAAAYYQPDLRVARATWQAATAGVQTAGARPNPSVSLAPQFVRNVEPGISPWVFGPSFDLPIETAGKRGHRIAKARHLSEAARFHLAEAAWKVRSQLRSRLLDLYFASQAEAVMERQQTAQARYLAALEEQQTAGAVSPTMMAQTHVAMDRTLLALGDARQRSLEAATLCAQALGVSTRALQEAVLSFDWVETLADEPAADELKRQALLRRPDLLAALEDYAASQANLQLEIAKQYPDLHLGPGYTWDQGTEKWSVGLSLSLPLLDRNQGPIAEAKAGCAASAARFEALQAAVLGELDRASAGYHTALESFLGAEAMLSTQRLQFREAQDRLNTEAVASAARLATEVELDAALLTRLQALVQAQHALGLLEDAAQSPLAPEAASAAPLEAPQP